MNASELADRLEYWREKIVESQSIDDDKLSTSAFASVAFNHAEVILKSLRFAADMERLLDSRLQQISALTAERDEARKEVERLKTKCEHKSQQLDAQVSLVVDFFTKPYCGQSMQSTCENHNKLADTARRAIASRDAEKKRADETAELLKWLAEKSENWSSIAFAAEADSTESLGKVRRIIEIVEGK